ncbi:ATG8-interacting protein 1 [Heracleum sosnowskyi]|uniref:ATG8-interacting protein 1 n=1 Tax=Heracleum sosnowskyi TaxID=360622 RepID=A0AAD8MIH9_9APIA|nr:ATG8-interacting protein 1 [Heracleum sosnowskyi]
MLAALSFSESVVTSIPSEHTSFSLSAKFVYYTFCCMADNKENREVPAHGNEWEVVSLSASAYAASPGAEQDKLKDDDHGHPVDEDKEGTSEAMFMSRHFVFPPKEGGISNTKDGENWDATALSMSDEFPGMQFVDEKGKSLSVSGTEFEEGIVRHGLTLVDKEQSSYSTTKFTSDHGEATIGRSAQVEENKAFAEPVDSSEEGSRSPKNMDEDKDDGSDLPCEAWWKRRALSLYAQAKEANAVWSIFIAAAVMGLVIIGQRWQVLQNKWPYGDEKMSKMLGPLSRLKDVIVGGQRSGSVIRSSTTAQR